MPVVKQKNTKEKINNLKKAYLDFLSSIEELEREEEMLALDLKKVIDKAEIHNVLQKISNIKEH